MTKGIIVILYYNKPSLTRKCIDSCARQSPLLPLLLVDNGSLNINLQNELKTYAQQYFFPSVYSIRFEKNLGFSAGMNAGLAFAAQEHDWAMLISNDVELSLDFTALTMKTLPNENEILCPTIHHLIARDQIAYTHGKFDLKNTLLSHHTEKYQKNKITFPDYYPAAVTIWHSNAYLQTGGFHTNYFAYWEDVELSYRLQSSSIQLTPRPDLIAFHLGKGTTRKQKIYGDHFKEGQKKFLIQCDPAIFSLTQ